MRRRVLIHCDDRGTAASIATVILVAMVAAMMTVVGLFVFDIIEIPEDPPEVKVVYSHLNDRWSAHVSSVTEERPLNEFRLAVRGTDGSYVLYDSDRDGTPDGLLSMKLDTISTSSGGGPTSTPVIFVDVDGDGRVSSGDSLIATGTFLPANSLLMDGSRGYKMVGLDPHGIPLDSDLVVVATGTTLVASGLMPGDEVYMEILHGGTVEATRSDHADASGSFTTEVYMDPAWHSGNHKASFVIRPGAVDEWTADIIFHSKAPEPITAEEAEQYEALKHPVGTGDSVVLIHIPTNTEVLSFTL